MSLVVESLEGTGALTEFVRFHDRVYEERSAHWEAFLPLELPLLLGESPFAEGRRLRPLQVCEGGEILARAVAVVDEPYNRHWGEQLGHVIMFEALPGARAAARLLMDEACAWLAGEGLEAARTGFGLLDLPFVIDDYASLPPVVLRQNPAYYHALLKDAGFEAEHGFVDYRIAVRPQLVARWESALQAARRGGFDIVPLGEVPEGRRAALVAALLNETFAAHWGWTPTTAAEQAALFALFTPLGFLDTSVVAYRDGDPVGQTTVVPEATALATLAPGRTLEEAEKLNFLSIGVRQLARGRGVNLALAAYAFLALARRGARHLSYTLVLDDNWPSRRTAEKLGAHVCANYLCYRRNFRR